MRSMKRKNSAKGRGLELQLARERDEEGGVTVAGTPSILGGADGRERIHRKWRACAIIAMRPHTKLAQLVYVVVYTGCISILYGVSVVSDIPKLLRDVTDRAQECMGTLSIVGNSFIIKNCSL